ncbi:MAG TPA: hypothetical protein VGJ91_11790, partial [Polyangiaceae bacterium]
SSGGTSSGGTSSGGTSSSGASSGSATGGAPSSLAGSGNQPASAGASGSTASGGRRIFYLDVHGSVRTFDEDKPTPRTLVSSAGKGPDGIAVDVAGGHLFWTTMGVPADNDGSLLRSELDGSKVTTIVPTGGSYTPKQLKLDLAGKALYWSDREGMRIQRAALDGSALETLVTVASGDNARKDASNWCVGLALDLVHGFVYWTQKGPDNGMVGSIRRAHLQMPAGETDSTRTDVQVLIEGLPEPVDLDLDVPAGYMYWSDRGDDTINRAAIEIPSGKTAATRGDRQILVQGVREAIGVTLDLERGHVYYTSGASGRVGRANLDGSGARDLVTGTGALTGIAVVQPAL